MRTVPLDSLPPIAALQPRPHELRVLGLDLSLTKCGWARVRALPGDVIGAYVDTGKLQPPRSLLPAKDDHYHDDRLHDRASWLAEQCVSLARGCQLVMIEHPLLAGSKARDSAIIKLVGVWAIVTQALREQHHDWCDVTPGQLKMYATGKGNAGKPLVSIEIGRMFPDVDLLGDDDADALAMAAAGVHKIAGQPLSRKITKRHAAALDNIAWPPHVDGLIREGHTADAVT